MYITKDCN